MSEPTTALSERQRAAIFAVSAGLAAIVALATLFHLFTRVSKQTPGGSIGGYFLDYVGWPFLIAYIAVSVGLEWVFRGHWMAALGMILPLPISLVLEPMGHNLFPIEMIVVWLPAFGLARLGVFLGGFLASSRRQPRPPNLTT